MSIPNKEYMKKLEKASDDKFKAILVKSPQSRKSFFSKAAEDGRLDEIAALCAKKNVTFEKDELVKLIKSERATILSVSRNGQLDQLGKLMKPDSSQIKVSEIRKDITTVMRYSVWGEKFPQFAEYMNKTGEPLNKSDLQTRGMYETSTIQNLLRKGSLDDLQGVLSSMGEKLERADIEEKDKKGNSGVYLATIGHCVEPLDKYLRDSGQGGITKAELMETGEGEQPLSALTYSGIHGFFKDVATVLERNNDKLSKKELPLNDRFKRTLLGLGAYTGEFPKIVSLVDEKVERKDIMHKNNSGETCVHNAISGGHLDQIDEFLADKGGLKTADIMAETERGDTGLHIAAFSGTIAQVFDVLEKNNDRITKSDLFKENKEQQNVIEKSVGLGNFQELATFLHGKGMTITKEDLQRKNREGETTLQYVVKRGYVDQLIEAMKLSNEEVSLDDVLKGTELFDKKKLGAILHDKKGKKLDQFFKAGWFDLKELNQFWKDTPKEYKTRESSLVLRRCQNRLRQEISKRLEPNVLSAKTSALKKSRG